METGQQKSVAIAEIGPIVSDIAAFSNTIESIDVCDEETQGQMGDFVKMMMLRRRKLEDKRTSLVGPLNVVVKDINEMFKGPRDRIDQLVKIAKDKIDNFLKAQHLIAEQKRKLEEEQAQKERAEAQALADALRKKVGHEEAKAVDVIVEQAEKKVEEAQAPAKVAPTRGQQSSVSTTKTWKAKVVSLKDIAKAVAEGRLPEHVLEPNMAALNSISRETKQDRTVDGVRFYLHISSAIR